MKEETKKKLKKYGTIALGAALLGGSAYAGKKAYDHYTSPERHVEELVKDGINVYNDVKNIGSSAKNDILHSAKKALTTDMPFLKNKLDKLVPTTEPKD